MTAWLWAACAVLGIVILFLAGKIFMMKKSVREISAEFTARLQADTNTLIDLSSGDHDLRRLAGEINGQLRLLQNERRRYQNGDLELKEAVTNISHDLRTPLTAICGYLDLLEREEKSEAAVRYTSLIQNRVEVMKKLTEELFRYSITASAKTDLTLENVVLNNVLEESIAAYYAALKQQGIVPELSFPEKKIERILDRSSLARIFENIIGNAIKYSDGDLSICLKPSGEIVFSNSAKQLTPVTAGRLFDRFFTVETGCGSTGLGLSIARELAELQKGSLTLTDTPGGGCTFLLLLPIAEDHL